MPTTIEIKGILEEKLEMLIEAGLYASKTEVVRDGLRKLLETQDFLSIALSLYKNGKISTGKAAEICNLTIPEFIMECQKRRVPVLIGSNSIEDIVDDIIRLKKRNSE